MRVSPTHDSSCKGIMFSGSLLNIPNVKLSFLFESHDLKKTCGYMAYDFVILSNTKAHLSRFLSSWYDRNDEEEITYGHIIRYQVMYASPTFLLSHM